MRRVAVLAPAARGQAERLEKEAGNLLGRADHELFARQLVRPRLKLGDAFREPRRDLAHPVGIDLHPGALHVGEHAGERQLDLAVEPRDATLVEPGEELIAEPARATGSAAN